MGIIFVNKNGNKRLPKHEKQKKNTQVKIKKVKKWEEKHIFSLNQKVDMSTASTGTI